METKFINQRSEKEYIDVVDIEIELSDEDIKNLLETENWRFECHTNMKHIDHIIIKKEEKLIS